MECTQCGQYKTRMLRSPTGTNGTAEPLAASHPCPSSTWFCFPQPHDFFPSPMTSLALFSRFGSFLMAHLPLQEPGARVTLLFYKTGLLPNCRHKAVAGGGPVTPHSPSGTFLGNPNLLLARQPCHLVPWVALAGRGKNTQSCLLCIIPLLFPRQPQPTLPPWGRGAPQPRSRDPEPFSRWVFMEYLLSKPSEQVSALIKIFSLTQLSHL